MRRLALGDHTTPYCISTGHFSWWQSGRSVRLTTRIHPVLRFSMSGAIPPLLPTCLHGVDTKNLFIYFFTFLPPAKLRDSTSTTPRSIPSKSFSIHNLRRCMVEVTKSIVKQNKKWRVMKLQPSTPEGEQICAWIYSTFQGYTQDGVGQSST